MVNKLQLIKKTMQGLGIIVCVAMIGAEANATENETFVESFQPLTHQNVIYTYDEMFEFNVSDYLSANAPHLLRHAEAISHYSAFATTSPKIFIALIEHQTGLVSTSRFDTEQVKFAFGELSEEIGFNNQLADIAGRINQNVYNDIGSLDIATLDVDAEVSSQLPVEQNARKVISAIFSFAKPSIHVQSNMLSELKSFNQIYRELFPQVSASTDNFTPSSVLAAPPSNFLQLPFPIGESWSNGGSHTFTGSGDYPQSSLDFNDGGGWGSNLDHLWVVAAAGGRVVVHSSCNVEVVHDDGWSTAYYHLDDLQVQTGDVIDINTPLAHYANNRNQALCEGGSSSGPHVHFSLKKDAQYFHLDGVALSGYVVHTGNDSYDGNCDRFWLKKEGEAKKCAWSQIRNNGVGGPTPEPEELVNNVAKTDLSGSSKQQLFYKMNVPSDATSLTFTTNGGSGDADLYVKLGSKPDLNDFDCKSTSQTSTETCEISDLQTGTYYVMVEAWSAISGVSLMGSYQGVNPDDFVLENGVAKNNLAASKGSTDKLFTFYVPDGATDISVEMSGGTGDADMYVKFGSIPSENDYDCRPYVEGNNEVCSDNRSDGIYYVLIKAFSDYSGVSLIGNYRFLPPIEDIDRTESLAVVNYNQWIHFTEELPSSYSTLNVTLSGGTGDADLYVRHGSQSTFQLFDCRPYNIGNEESCTIDLPAAGTWYFDVYGYGKSGSTDITLKIQAPLAE